MNLDSRLLSFPLYVCCNFLYTSSQSDHRTDASTEPEGSTRSVCWPPLAPLGSTSAPPVPGKLPTFVLLLLHGPPSALNPPTHRTTLSVWTISWALTFPDAGGLSGRDVLVVVRMSVCNPGGVYNCFYFDPRCLSCIVFFFLIIFILICFYVLLYLIFLQTRYTSAIIGSAIWAVVLLIEPFPAYPIHFLVLYICSYSLFFPSLSDIVLPLWFLFSSYLIGHHILWRGSSIDASL